MARLVVNSKKHGIKIIYFDSCDLKSIKSYKWFVVCKGLKKSIFYAVTTIRDVKTKQRRLLLMHRLIMNPKNHQEIDHRNLNGLDNRRQNLRICTHAENMRNRRPRENKSGYKGVYFSREKQRFRALITVNKKVICVKHCHTAVEAARAYNEAALKYFGEFALLNKV